MDSPSISLSETSISLISEGTRIQGLLEIEGTARVHGTVEGQLQGRDASVIIIGETGLVDGEIFADQLLINGTVRGEIKARTRVTISGSGRVIGTIQSPSLNIEFGAYFEGRSVMEKGPLKSTAAVDTSSPFQPSL